MANVDVTINKTIRPNEPTAAFEFKATAASDTIRIPFDGKDQQTTFIVTAESACNLTIKAGDSLQGVNDEVIAITATSTMPFLLIADVLRIFAGKMPEKSL